MTTTSYHRYGLRKLLMMNTEDQKLHPGPERPSSLQKRPLEFPSFRQKILMQSSWDARDNDSRIKVLLSEQLVGTGSGSTTGIEAGNTHEVVCFSFQHAPQDILEQAGISWPIRNPLFLSPLAIGLPHNLGTYRTTSSEAINTQLYPTYEKHFGVPTSRPGDTEPIARPKTAAGSYHRQESDLPMTGRSQGKTGLSRGSVSTSGSSPFEDVNMLDNWSTQRSNSGMATDISMPDITPASSIFRAPWNNHTSIGRSTYRNMTSEKQQVVMTSGNDQFNNLIKAVSPPKKTGSRNRSSHSHHQELGSRPPTPHIHAPNLDCSGLLQSTKPSAAAVARSASYPHLRESSNKASPARKKDKRDPSNARKPSTVSHPSGVGGKENDIPTPYPVENRIPTPFPFMQGPGPHPPLLRYSVGGTSDIEMRDPSTHSSQSRASRTHIPPVGKNSPVPPPAENSSIMSRKEGLGINPPGQSFPEVRHDRSLLPALDTPNSEHKVPHNTPMTASPNAKFRDLLNPHLDSKSFVPGHRSGMSSLDRIGQQLFSALGDMTSSFDDNAGSGTIDSGTLPELDFESPIMKRKRQGTIGGERGKSPDAKMMKERVDLTRENQ